MPRNNPEQRKTRMQAALHRAAECLDVVQGTCGSETFLVQAREDLRSLENQLERRDALDPRVTVIAVAGPSGTGKSTVVNTLARRNSLVPTGMHRPTTTELVAYVDAEVTAAPFLELSGIPRSVSVEFCTTRSNPLRDSLGMVGEGHQVRSALTQCGHPIVVEVPDTLLVPELTSAASQVLETADLILWTTDSQKYADAAFHSRISAFPRHPNSYFVLTHTEGLTESQLQTLNQELAAIAERIGVSPEILQISLYDESSLARFRETVAELSHAPEARWRGQQAAIHHAATKLGQDLELDVTGEFSTQPVQAPSVASPPSPAETKLVDQVTQVSGLSAMEANFSKQYLRAGGFWTLWPVLNWLAGIKPLAHVNQDNSATPGEPEADKPVGPSADPSPEQTADESATPAVADSTPDPDLPSIAPQADSLNRFFPRVNVAGITSAARTYAATASAHRPSKWVDFAQLKAVELSGNLVSALNLALESWKFPARPARTWWRIWRLGHWFWLAALVVGLLWSLVAGVAFLGGAGTSAAVWMVGPVPFPLLVLVAAVAGTLVWSLVGTKILHCGARNYGRECADKFRSLIQEVTRQGFLVKMNQNLDLYPQLSELVSEMRSRDTQSR
ncbi:ABC transporter [uncultured Mobiluncus sp.]|uniref:ABC transporter n=1 Tax=uncultured Mobiluncus sp. TaxID=293425 RepID=UPI0025E0B563|nr:ABC transporter [uncultured Mobiluncus sp.]